MQKSFKKNNSFSQWTKIQHPFHQFYLWLCWQARSGSNMLGWLGDTSLKLQLCWEEVWQVGLPGSWADALLFVPRLTGSWPHTSTALCRIQSRTGSEKSQRLAFPGETPDLLYEYRENFSQASGVALNSGIMFYHFTMSYGSWLLISLCIAAWASSQVARSQTVPAEEVSEG